MRLRTGLGLGSVGRAATMKEIRNFCEMRSNRNCRAEQANVARAKLRELAERIPVKRADQ